MTVDDSANGVPTGPTGVRIVHRGRSWVAVDKPSGLFVHRTRLGPDRDVLLQRVRDRLGRRVSPVHRLDRPTSGLVLFGFDGETVRELQEALARPTTRKLYVALVRGCVDRELLIERPLTAESGSPKDAATEVRPLATAEDGRFSAVLLRPRTGRRHQLRRHLGGLGHHVLGDVRYGKGRVNRELRERIGLHRLALHAWRLDLDHEGGLRLEAPIPEDLATPLAALGIRLAELAVEATEGEGP